MNKVSRNEWGARRPKTTPLGIRTQSATGHWEGTQMGSFPHESCATKMRVIQNYHMDTQGWNDIAYNFAVCPHGYVFVGRDHGVRSSANGTNTGNSESEAVCYLGGLGDEFTIEGEFAFREIMFEISSTQYCHNHWFNTMCPGPQICDEIKNGYPKTQIPIKPDPLKDEDMVPASCEDGLNRTWNFYVGDDLAMWAELPEVNEGKPWKIGGTFTSGLHAHLKIPTGEIVVVGRGSDGKMAQIIIWTDGSKTQPPGTPPYIGPAINAPHHIFPPANS